MNRVDFFSIICGFLAMTGVGIAAMVVGYDGMSFARPWLMLFPAAVLVEVLLMRWVGPLPGGLVLALLSPLAKRWPRLERWLENLFYLLILATAVGLTYPMLRLMRAMVQ